MEKGACLVKTEQLDGIDEQLVAGDDSGEGLGNIRVEKGGDGEELVSLNTVVEEGLGKASLIDEVELNPVDESSGSDSESESSDSSSSSSGEDDDGVEEGEDKEVSKEVKENLEEGEIMETDEEDGDDDDDADIFNEFLMDDEDDDEGGGVKGPIMSKNELKAFNPADPNQNNMVPPYSPLPAGGMVPNTMNQDPLSMALVQLVQLSMLSEVLLSSGLLAGQGGPGGNNMQQFPPNLQQNPGGNNMQHPPPNSQQNAEALPPPQFNQGAGSGPPRPGGRRGGGRSGGRG